MLSSLIVYPSSFTFSFDFTPLKERFNTTCEWGKYILDKHTDLISSLGILTITTCLLAAKIFKNTPVLLTRAARVVFDFGGIIWLNVQMRDLLKTYRDCGRAFANGDHWGIADTLLKAVFKTINVILTCGLFAAAIMGALGFAELTTTFYFAMRPFGLGSLVANILSDLRDYQNNNELILSLNELQKEKAIKQIHCVMVNFHQILNSLDVTNEENGLEKKLADRLVRQLDNYSVEIFQEACEKKEIKNSFRQSLLLFGHVRKGMEDKKVSTEDNLNLTLFMYFSMGICRAFPDSLVEMSLRWLTSVFYTDELINQKIRHYHQIKRLNLIE